MSKQEILSHSDFYPLDRLNRRRFIKLAGGSALFILLFPSLAACGSPSAEQIEEQKLEQLKETLKRNVKEQYNMELKARFQLSSGIWASIFSDGPNLILNQQAVDQTFEAAFMVLDDQSNTRFKRSLLKAKEEISYGKFKDREVYFLVSSNPQACIDENTEIATILSEDRGKYCETNANTVSVLNVDLNQLDKGTLPETKFAFTILTAASFKGKTILAPAGSKFILTPEESLSSGLSHEAMHIFLRMVAEPLGGDEEENFVQGIERDLLLFYQNNPDQRPIPFIFQ